MSRFVGICLCSVLVACSSDGICTSVAIGTAGFSTDADFGQCWDGQDRAVHCVGAPTGGPITCTCTVAGNLGATFVRTEPLILSSSPTEAELAPINTGCSWALRPR